jgi:predicted RNase H-like HicB family nuclease
MKYLVIYEKSGTGWGAYAPDLPGLGIAAKTLDEAKDLIREALNFISKAFASMETRFLSLARQLSTSQYEDTQR